MSNDQAFVWMLVVMILTAAFLGLFWHSYEKHQDHKRARDEALWRFATMREGYRLHALAHGYEVNIRPADLTELPKAFRDFLES